MTVSPVASGAELPTGPRETASSELDEQAFLRLLMTQLAHQDPTSPVETDRFMDQLASLTQVQELIEVNHGLDDLLMGISSLNNEASVNLVGREVTAQGDGFHLGEGEDQRLHFDLPADATEVHITIESADGAVHEVVQAGPHSAGQGSFVWNARDREPPAPAGEYRFSVRYEDENGDVHEATPLVEGRVDEIRFDTGIPILVVDGFELPLADVLTVRMPGTDRLVADVASTRGGKTTDATP